METLATHVTLTSYKTANHMYCTYFPFIYFFKVIVSSLKDGTLYISADEGKTFKSTSLAISPHVISCSPYSDQWIVAHDTKAKKV